MKKILAFVLTLMFTLTAVGAFAEAPAEEKEPSKTLVVYFSATGSTERIANMIAEATGADVFVIDPTQPYTDDDLNWTNRDSRVSYEHDHPETQNEVALNTITPENWENYETVYIGYPIWWGIAAWPVNQFVTGNDFTGKTVIPFCTSEAPASVRAANCWRKRLARANGWRVSASPTARRKPTCWHGWKA